MVKGVLPPPPAPPPERRDDVGAAIRDGELLRLPA
uniref:Uncharacterized protein n=1 Tax=Romanomermis culicivorax TaxID=13658 RepID=A0A915LB69_ROMCU